MIRSTTSTKTAILRATRAASQTKLAPLTQRQSRSKSSMASVRRKPLRVAASKASAAAVQASSDPKTAILNASKNHRRRQQHQLVAASRNSSLPPVFQNYDKYRRNNGSPGDNQTNEEEEKWRVAAMRLFLNSLQRGTANIALSNEAASKALGSGAQQEYYEELHGSDTIFRNGNEQLKMTETDVVEIECKTDQAEAIDLHRIKEGVELSDRSKDDETNLNSEYNNSHREEITNLHSTTSIAAPSRAEKKARNFDRFKSALRRSIHRKDLKKSLFLFQKFQDNDQVLPRVIVTDLFFMVSESDPVAAYSIMQYYNSNYSHQSQSESTNNSRGILDLDSATNKRRSLYKRIANSISLLDPIQHNTRQMHVMINSLLSEVEEMDIESKRLLYPKLVSSLAAQRITTIGQYAHGLYESMIDRDFDMKIGWLNRLLGYSRYNRQDDVPYHDVMARMVQLGGRLKPESALPAIENMFPFTKTEAVCVALGAWLEDFRNKHGCDVHDGGPMELNPEDLIDLSILEAISVGASQAGSSELILLVWDILEACGYSATEAIYENTVMTFANKKGGLQQAFVAMSSMKEDGFEPSRALIRSFSSTMRHHRFLIGKSLRVLIDDHQNEMSSIENNHLLSLESLNVILSSYAERGDPDDAVEVLNVMTKNDIEPNADSYSFIIEAMGRGIKKRQKSEDHDYMQRSIEIADTILSMMEEKGISPNTHLIRNYVELLCLAGECKTATSLVEDYLSSSDIEIRNTINNITIHRVASEELRLGDFERAKVLALQMTEYVPALHRKIRSKEERYLYLQENGLEAPPE